LSLLVALASPIAAQQSSACSLLTPSEIESAAGAKAGPPQSSAYSTSFPVSVGVGLDATIDDPKKSRVQACKWTFKEDRGRGWITATIGNLPAGTSAETVAKHNPVMDGFRRLNWIEEAKDFGNTWCSVMQSTASEESALMLSTCSADVEGTILSVTINSSKRHSIDQTKALLDKAIAHQH
jgi:hypothetical protein